MNCKNGNPGDRGIISSGFGQLSDTPIVIGFNRPVNAASLTAASVRLSDGTNPVEVFFKPVGSDLYF